LPFTFAELLHKDYRWIAFIVWCIACLKLFNSSMKINKYPLGLFLLLLLLNGNYLLANEFNSLIILTTVEIMIAGYYMLFISGLNQQNAIIQGLFISCCLLSRYSLILWLPLYAFVLLISKNRKLLIGASITIIIMALIFYIIPFMSKDWSSFYNGYKYYDKAALHEWTYIVDGKPVQLFQGTGFAYYIYTRFTNLDIMQRINLIQKIHLIACISISLIMGLWYYFNKDKINYKIFLLGSFKIYLSVFLFLIQVPYVYLMITGSFVSIAILIEQGVYTIQPRNSNNLSINT
jgi:hypothetical protein